VVDPEGLVRIEAGAGEELITDVLDLDAVTRVRSVGSFGLNRLLDQFDRLGPALELPMYGGYVPQSILVPEEGQ
jgi:formamidase